MGEEYELRYGWFGPLLGLLGIGRRVSGVDRWGGEMRARMGWAFRATIPIASVRSVRTRKDNWFGVGVHGWRGRWLVNGSVKGIVTVDIDPPVSARAGLIPIKLRELQLSMDDPDRFVAAVEAAGGGSR